MDLLHSFYFYCVLVLDFLAIFTLIALCEQMDVFVVN